MPLKQQIDPSTQELLDQLLKSEPGQLFGPPKSLATPPPAPLQQIQSPEFESAQAGVGPAAMALILKRIAGQRGLNFADKGLGRSLITGASGERLGLQQAGDFLNVSTVGSGAGGSEAARNLLELVDEAAQAGDVVGTRGTTGTSAAAEASIQKGVQAGRLAKNPGGPGFISKASGAGRKFLEKGGGALKGVASGITALLAPLIGALQDPSLGQDLDPELRGTLEMVLGLLGSSNVQGPQG